MSSTEPTGFGRMVFELAMLLLLVPLSTTVNASDSSEPRWMFSIGEFPVIEGDVVVRTGMVSNMRYTAASETSTIQLTMAGTALQSLMIRNKETKIACMKSDGTLITTENGRLNFTGTVNCMTNPTNPRERESFAVEGWFGLED